MYTKVGDEMRIVKVTPELHKQIKILAAQLEVPINEVIQRGIDMLEGKVQ